MTHVLEYAYICLLVIKVLHIKTVVAVKLSDIFYM